MLFIKKTGNSLKRLVLLDHDILNKVIMTFLASTLRSPGSNVFFHYIKPNNQFMVFLSQGVLQHTVNQTACFRFPGQLNADLRKLAVNMVPLTAK